MKKLTAILASVAFIGSAYAADSEVSQNAEFRLRYKLDQNVKLQDTGTTTGWNSRVKWGSTFRAGEKFTGHLAVLHNSTFGVSGAASDNEIGTPASEFISENALVVQNAYVNWMISNDLMLKVGRMPVVIGDERVMGENDYQVNPYAFEGFGLGYESEFAHVGFYGLKLVDATAANDDNDNQRNLYIVNVDFKSLPEFLSMANLHIIADNQNAFPNTPNLDVTAKTESTRYGIAVGGESMGVDYRVTYEAVNGEQGLGSPKQDLTQDMMDIELGYSFDWMGSRVFALHHVDSGDTDSTDNKTETYDSFFYEKQYNAGLMDLFKWGNLTYTTVGYTMKTSDATEYGLHYTMFNRTEKTDNFANNNMNYTVDNTKDDLGSEIDLYATHKYDAGLDIITRLGMFSPGDALKDSNNQKEDHLQFFVQARWKF